MQSPPSLAKNEQLWNLVHDDVSAVQVDIQRTVNWLRCWLLLWSSSDGSYPGSGATQMENKSKSEIYTELAWQGPESNCNVISKPSEGSKTGKGG